MPRISPQREREVRERIVRATMVVLAERGFDRATLQDVVRVSGLSVGAIYTHFTGKSELILASCQAATGQEIAELRRRLVEAADYRERITVAVGYFLDQVAGPGPVRAPASLLVQAWALAAADPATRDLLVRRRREIVMTCATILEEGIVRGELPAWLEVAAVAHGMAALLDGIILQSVEEGAAFRRADAERRVLSVIETMLASAGAAEPTRLVAPPPRQ